MEEQTPSRFSQKKIAIILGILLALIVTGVVLMPSSIPGKIEQPVAPVQAVNNNLQAMEDKVAQDAVDRFKMVLKDGSVMEAYVQSQVVVAAYLQAKDTTNYREWKKIEKKLARKVRR